MMYSDVMVDGGARHGGSSCFRAWLERHRWRQDFFPYTPRFNSDDMGKTTMNLNEDVSHIENIVMFQCYVGFPGVIFVSTNVCWKPGQSKGRSWKWHSGDLNMF